MKKTFVRALIVTFIGLAIAVLSALIPMIGFMGSVVKNQAEANDLLSIYDDTEFDFIVKNPSHEQIASFGVNDSANKVVPFYEISYAFNISGESVDVTIKSIDDSDDLCCTEFSTARIIKEADVSGNRIYVDYGLIKKYGLGVGDVIGSGRMTFVIAGFYRSYDTYLAFSPDLKDMIVSEFTYSGVYIDAKDPDEFRSKVLSGYKPLGTLKERSSFSDDEAYASYLEHFNERDYSVYIWKKNTGYDEARESYGNKTEEVRAGYRTIGIVSGAIALIGFVGIALLSARRTGFEVVDGARKSVLGRYLAAAVFAVVGVFATWIVGAGIFAARQFHYISVSDIMLAGWLGIALPIGGVLLGTAICILILRGYKEKKR